MKSNIAFVLFIAAIIYFPMEIRHDCLRRDWSMRWQECAQQLNASENINKSLLEDLRKQEVKTQTLTLRLDQSENYIHELHIKCLELGWDGNK